MLSLEGSLAGFILNSLYIKVPLEVILLTTSLCIRRCHNYCDAHIEAVSLSLDFRSNAVLKTLEVSSPPKVVSQAKMLMSWDAAGADFHNKESNQYRSCFPNPIPPLLVTL